MSLSENSSLAELIASLPAEQRNEVFAGLSDPQLETCLYDWRGLWARSNQLRPGTTGASNSRTDWTYWVLKGGRGMGKTRTGAETVREWVSEGVHRIHLVAPTAADIRDVMVEGPSGLMNVFPPSQRPRYEPSKRKVTFYTGAEAYAFSAEEPERLRGPQCERVWGDEIAAWQYGEETWDQMCFGLRIGDNVQGVFTSTPKPTKFIKSVLSHPRTVVTHGSTYENRANLAPGFFADILRKYEGTRLGRQEIEAELLEDLPGALWTRSMIDNHRVTLDKVPTLFRVVISIDPAVTAGEDSNETGIVAVGLGHNRHCYVLEDATCRESPGNWARIACKLFLKWNADRMIGEVNNGGELVGHAIHTIHHGIPYRAVRATRGKAKRAEPAAALYEQGKVHHVGVFPKMEDQLCGFVPGLEDEQDSPDRMDALVWGLTDLVIDPEDQYIVHSSPQRFISPI